MADLNLTLPDDGNLDPVISEELPRPVAPSRQELETRMEDKFGPLKPVAQFINVLASPSVKDQIFAGPINAVSQLGNAIGDLAQGKKVDVSDAWQISPETARRFNPLTIGSFKRDEFTEADESGAVVGQAIGAEFAGFATTGGLSNVARRVPQVMSLVNGIKQSQTVKNLAVATKNSPSIVRGALGFGATTAKAVPGATAAVAFIDPKEGNIQNLGDLTFEGAPLYRPFGLPIENIALPGRVDESDDYFTALGKNIAVDGFFAPLMAIGAGALVPSVRRSIVDGGATFFDDLAEVELEPYLFAPPTPEGRMLPPARHDSAISRALDEQTQIKQVEQQRNRLQDMGLVEQGGGGQLELSMPGVIDPEIKLQVRQLQTLRGQLIKQSAESGEDLVQQLGQVDQQIADLVQAGRSPDMPASATFTQPELDLPDGRPEMDTMLAQLDELDDAELRRLHGDTTAADRQANNDALMEQLQATVDQHPQRLQAIEARLAEGDITEKGAKRLLTKQTKALEAAQQELQALQQRTTKPEVLVGDQLELAVTQQLGIDFAETPALKTFDEVAQSKVLSGYKTPTEYRDALMQFPRDVLRGMTSPTNSPRVAGLIKARTGRRVWQAKKQDIIDALVELSERDGRYLPPEMAQGDLNLTMNQFGVDAPLFELPADLNAGGRVVKIVDADGVEQVVPVSDYIRRGMDPVLRERMKKEILEQAVRNGEVQPPITPVPVRPQLELQGELLFDEGLQLDLLGLEDTPIYKASGKPVETLLEELRLRYDYHQLDTQAAKAERQALKDALRWQELSWDEKKRIGLTEPGVYDPILFNKALDELPGIRDPQSPPNVAGAVEDVSAPVGKKLRWTAQGLIEEGAPLPEPPPAYNWIQRLTGKDPAFNEQAGLLRQRMTRPKKAKSKKVAAAAPEEVAQNKQLDRDLAAREAQVEAELKQLQNESTGAKC